MGDDTAAERRPEEYPDRAGYPDGEGTLDEGTGAFRTPADDDSLDDVERFAMEDEEDE